MNSTDADTSADEGIPMTEQSSDTGTSFTEMTDSEPSSEREIAATQTAISTEQLLSSEEAKLASMSLCDEVIERLHWQLKRHTLRGEQKTDFRMAGQEEIARSKIVLGTTSEIAKMIRLKIDAVKVFRELDKD